MEFRTAVALLSVLGLIAGAWAQGNSIECEEAVPCNYTNCTASPDCACAGQEPTGVDVADRPQIVYITFDDALTAELDQNYFTDLFSSFTNPNGCPIRGTFFLTHESTDYTLVNYYYSLGHEIASESISKYNKPEYWEGLDVEGWRSEITAMRDMIAQYALVPPEAITGMRAPYLLNGGNTMFTMLQEDNFTYDATQPTNEFGYMNMANGRWPHTLDYLREQDCQIPPCPTCSFPGIWSQNILELEDSWYGSVEGNDTIGSPCSMLDSCDIVPSEDDPQEVYDLLKKNFERAYYGNTRAPLGFYIHAAWWAAEDLEWRFEGFKMWIEDMMTNYDDVWIVPVKAGIEYMKNPVPKDELDFFEPFGCFDLPEFTCIYTRDCRYTDVEYPDFDFEAQEIYMPSCVSCPPNYPWVGNPDGELRSVTKNILNNLG